MLPLLFLACLENSSVRWNPALGDVAVGRLATGPTDGPRSDPGGGLLLLNVLLVVGGDAIALPQIRLRKTEPTSLLPELGVRMEVRTLVVLPGIMPLASSSDVPVICKGGPIPVWSWSSIAWAFAGVPAARCKTSLASAYGLMSETSPAFTLPASPLLSTLLSDINLALSKFLEDQIVHGFLPVPGRRHRRYYSTSSSSFPGPYTVPPGVTSITLEKASEVKKRSVSLSASQVSSMETMLSGMCEVSSWLDWWLSTCGGFRDHLPIEVRADFERLMISGSRALEFLASQGCTTLGNLVLARRDALLADVRGTVPAEEVARLRYSPLPLTASIFPYALLDSALLKMRAAASDALVQRTLHPPRIPRKPAASGQSGGSSTARSGQASISGASQTQKQSASSSPSGQSGQRKKKSKGKAPFSSSSRGSDRSGGKGKGAGKKSA